VAGSSRTIRSFTRLIPILAVMVASGSGVRLAAQPPPPAPPAGSAAIDQIKITGGLVAYQVLQRDERGTGTATISGTAAARFNSKYTEARVTKGDTEVRGWTALNQVKAGKWTGTLSNIPTGGPYTVEVRLIWAQNQAVTAAVDNILVGDLWVLAGQSNMEGVGNLEDTTPPISEVHSFDMTDAWVIAKDPLHTMPSAVDRVHWRKNKDGELERLTGEPLETFVSNRKKGAGPGLPFALEMYRRTGVPVGLVPCAHGGTSMDQWSPSLKAEAGASLYGATVRRIQAVGGKIKGVLWYQGEADANPKLAPDYQAKFEALIQAFRTDAGQPDLHFYFAQIGRHVSTGGPVEWNAVQEAERQVELKVAHTGMAAAIDVALDDGIHVSTQDQKRIGRRLAALAAHDLYADSAKENAAVKRGPRLASVKYADHVIHVSFNEVNGQLTSEGRISGFAILNPEGQALAAIYKARFDAADPNGIELYVQGDLPVGSTLKYGLGRDPYCNVRDTLDMALPVFGPVPIEGIPVPAPVPPKP
jgi:sialate O-acetylesterase